MTGAFDLRSVAGWFRLVALLEAVSWVGLLVGMYFKYLGSPRTEVGVKVFGMAHGLVFIAFVAVGLLAGIAFKWATGTWLLALLASIVPLCSVIFLIWADRTGKMGAPAGAVAMAQPGRHAPETTYKLVGVTRPRPVAAVESMEHPEVIGTWMTCGDSPHDLAVIKGPNAKLHHFAFHLEDWGAILRAGDIFSMDDVPIDIGPTRHGITRGTTIYFFDPSGNRNEVFAGLGYRVHKDFPTINWTVDQLAKGIFYHARELNDRFTTVFT